LNIQLEVLCIARTQTPGLGAAWPEAAGASASEEWRDFSGQRVEIDFELPDGVAAADVANANCNQPNLKSCAVVNFGGGNKYQTALCISGCAMSPV